VNKDDQRSRRTVPQLGNFVWGRTSRGDMSESRSLVATAAGWQVVMSPRRVVALARRQMVPSDFLANCRENYLLADVISRASAWQFLQLPAHTCSGAIWQVGRHTCRVVTRHFTAVAAIWHAPARDVCIVSWLRFKLRATGMGDSDSSTITGQIQLTGAACVYGNWHVCLHRS